MLANDTQQLTRSLVTGLTPVQPLPGPWVRAAAWCAISMLVVCAIAFVVASTTAAGAHADRRIVVQQLAALATGFTAAAAAFATTVPGYRRWIVVLPLVPLAVWLGDLGQSCLQDALASGPSSSSLVEHWGCVPATMLFGAIPASAIVIMLRRGAPLTPGLTTLLAAVAASGLANVGVRFVHATDASIVVLAWHVTALLVISALSATAGRSLFNWRQLTAA